MKLLIVGATGRTGRELVRQALERGHEVTAFARRPAKLDRRHERLTVARGDVLDVASVESAVRGQDAVLCALGHKRWFYPSRILSEGTRFILPFYFYDKVRQERVIRGSGLDWVIVRPGVAW